MAANSALPPMVPFPEAAWRNHFVPEEWEACLDAWISLAGAHISLRSPEFTRTSCKDESIPAFLTSYASENALSHDVSASNLSKTKHLRRQCYLLSRRILEEATSPETLLQWQFLADFSNVYGKTHGGQVVAIVWRRHLVAIEASVASLKTTFIKNLEAGLKGDLKSTEASLRRLNHLLHASPQTAAFFMAGSDFLDSLISCYKLMNPPLRKVILSTTYLCTIGLTEGEKPNFSSLVDQLYSLKAAAEAHKSGPTNVNDSLVAELVTVTPILKQIQQKIEASGSGSSRAKSVITALEGFKKAGGMGKPRHLVKRKIDKGKGLASNDYGNGGHGQIHVHRMSLISQVQDLFPDFGSAFIVKLLDEYNDDVEQVIGHLLEDSLPSHLVEADRSESLDDNQVASSIHDMAPHSTPPQIPSRRNVFDDDEFDQLAVDASKLHFGRRNPNQTADDVLDDRANAPDKAAILSALAAFDSDDDERDDTYDVADVGGTVDSASPEEVNTEAKDAHDEVLFRTYKSSPEVFGREAETRRGKPRAALRQETGLTDQAIEGWGLLLSRDPRQVRRLEAKFSAFTGNQKELAPTAWRASPAGSGTEDSDIDGNGRRRGRGAPFMRGRGGRGRGFVTGPSGQDTDKARSHKAANKGSRANHNRRDQRARKMARGGFPG